MNTYESWGRYPQIKHHQIEILPWKFLPLPHSSSPILPYGRGRSYGDVCLNENGTLLDTQKLNHFMAFDPEQHLLTCEAGVSLEEILELIVPQGFFLPTTPGTQYITVGGAIANDVHGKNHHRAGTFGCHVTQFELVRSNGERFLCSPSQNKELFCATIGGLGLTGLITWAQFRVTPIPSPLIQMETIKVKDLDDFFSVSAESDDSFEHIVSWIDCSVRGKSLGRGHFMRGNFAEMPPSMKRPHLKKKKSIPVPFNAPNFALNALTIRCFNWGYYHRQWRRLSKQFVHYRPFFYPLDSLTSWNRIYGRRGFFQHQFVVPFENDTRAIQKILELIANSKMGSFLAVLKTFGDIPSPGILSFPRKGVTLALDFPNQGKRSLELFRKIDEIVLEHQGVVYPAKDARMSAFHFQQFYPQWQKLLPWIDPNFSSSFWRRVTTSLSEHTRS